jgi:S-adenosylmethionine-dependent methyltransferase
MSTNAADERFSSDARRYAAYLETPEGRLRLDIAFANLQEFLPQATQLLRVLDLGCGNGVLGLRHARLGHHVTMLDASQAMLDLAERAAEKAGVSERIALQDGDATQISRLFKAKSFDVILCHNVLEFVENTGAVLRGAARLLRSSSAILSVLVRNQPGEVLKAALVNGDLTEAEHTLRTDWGNEALYGGKVRLFSANSLRAMLEDASLAVIAERGVRVVSDYLPAKISRTAEYERIFQLERKLGVQPEFAAIARYTQCVARAQVR